LAILIEGYTKVKEGMADSKGLLEELHGVLTHETRRLLQFFCRGPSNFISDDRLESELAALISNAPTSMNKAISDYASVALGNFMEVPAFHTIDGWIHLALDAFPEHNRIPRQIHSLLQHRSSALPNQLCTHSLP
jgi:hypothetical protein